MNEGILGFPKGGVPSFGILAQGDVSGIQTYEIDVTKWSKLPGLKLEIDDLYATVAGNVIYLRTAYDRGNIRSGGTDYFYQYVATNNVPSGPSNVNANSNGIPISYYAINTVSPLMSRIDFPTLNPSVPTVAKYGLIRSTYIDNASGTAAQHSGMFFINNSIASNYLYIMTASGTLSFKWRLIGTTVNGQSL